jgi:hypothetical protein
MIVSAMKPSRLFLFVVTKYFKGLHFVNISIKLVLHRGVLFFMSYGLLLLSPCIYMLRGDIMIHVCNFSCPCHMPLLLHSVD